jgi:anhydro-N-acetylmuramic acid kinase
MGKMMRAIGLMSGTSMDGIDVALVETDGEADLTRGPALTVSYDESFRSALKRAIAEARNLADRTDRPGCLTEVERELTERHAAAVGQFLAQRGLQPADIDVAGFHGHTVWHAPEQRDGPARRWVPLLARRIGIDVVYDLRAADCAAGGREPRSLLSTIAHLRPGCRNGRSPSSTSAGLRT